MSARAWCLSHRRGGSYPAFPASTKGIPMRLAVLKERADSETRVAATAETVKKLVGLGLTVAVESGAGASAATSDADYQAAAALPGAGIVFAVRPPAPEQRGLIERGTLLVCIAGAHGGEPGLVASLAEAGIDTVAMELLPR